MNGNIKDYAVAATRYIIDLEEAYDLCAGKIDALNEWYMIQAEATEKVR